VRCPPGGRPAVLAADSRSAGISAGRLFVPVTGNQVGVRDSRKILGQLKLGVSWKPAAPLSYSTLFHSWNLANLPFVIVPQLRRLPP
jgi:hypothetical protein